MAANSFAAWDHTRRMAQTLALAYFIFFACLLALLAGIAFLGRPSDGDPVARLELKPPPARHVHQAAAHPPASTAPISVAPSRPATPVPPQVVPSNVDKPVVVGKNLVADPALIEATPQGPLPRIGSDGRMPMTAYAPPIPTAKGPRIAIVVGDLGISAKGTAAAIQGLPPGVTLAFAPYEEDVGRWVGEARRTGHEVLLEVPMEPFDFPDSDPGPHTLRAAVGEESNTERLVWSLTRFTGYAGITNFLGGRFLSDADSLEPVMTYVARRGLLFFDSSPQGKTVAPDVARRINAPYVQSTTALDTIQTGMEIDARLSQLEQLARVNGSASGTASVSPIVIERIANWAKGLQGRGFVLVPASAIVAAPK
ncbi:MAG TPA: divergent polysaccharide deacetylase family protein [Rhizomicrobium sp.]|nr:divergent polysaccharide deacetylase family protein [Rhizomicrobium sp.]